MDPNVDKQKEKEVEEQEKEEVQHFKLTLTHKSPKGLENATRDILNKISTMLEADKKPNIKASGPARMPTKRMHITTRKSPCGNGTNTFDHFQMRIHKRVFHITCSQKNFQAIVGGLHTEPGMIMEAIQQ